VLFFSVLFCQCCFAYAHMTKPRSFMLERHALHVPCCSQNPDPWPSVRTFAHHDAGVGGWPLARNECGGPNQNTQPDLLLLPSSAQRNYPTVVCQQAPVN
jgi:hypothetical protein